MKIKFHDEDYEVFLCKNKEVAKRIIREFFEEFCDEESCLGELEVALSITGIGYWEITEQEIINK